MSIRRAVFGAVAAGGLFLSGSGGAEAQDNQRDGIVHYEFPSHMNRTGGYASVAFQCSLFGRDSSQPERLFPTCDAASMADNNRERKFCTVPNPSSSAPSRERLQSFATAGAQAYSHFAGTHKVCKARDAQRRWQVNAQNATTRYVESNPGTTSAQARQYFNRQLVNTMREFNIPQNPSDPSDLNYQARSENWPDGWVLCPFDDIAAACREELGLDGGR